MMTYWIPEGPSMLPGNASHQVGVGGFVINEKNEVLLLLVITHSKKEKNKYFQARTKRGERKKNRTTREKPGILETEQELKKRKANNLNSSTITLDSISGQT